MKRSFEDPFLGHDFAPPVEAAEHWTPLPLNSFSNLFGFPLFFNNYLGRSLVSTASFQFYARDTNSSLSIPNLLFLSLRFFFCVVQA
jgi:hypothetical protein